MDGKLVDRIQHQGYIVHITNVHRADDIRIFRKECRTLAANGYKVTLLAPSTKPAINIEGVQVLPLVLRRGRVARMTAGIWSCYRQAVHLNGDVYHFHDPELMPVGLLLKARGKKVVYDVHEDLPKQILTKNWIYPRVRRVVAFGARCAESFVGKVVDRVVCATPSIARNFSDNKVVLVQNYPLKNELATSSLHTALDRHSVIYVGGVSKIRGAVEMVRAMSLLHVKSDIRLLMVGDIESEELRRDLEDTPGWERTSSVGWKSRDEVADLLSTAAVGLVLFHPAPNHIESQPNKLFEYMSASVPVIASNFPLWRQVIDSCGCGLTVDPLNPLAIARTIENIIDDSQTVEMMGRQGKQAVFEYYNWERESSSLLSMYAELLPQY